MQTSNLLEQEAVNHTALRVSKVLALNQWRTTTNWITPVRTDKVICAVLQQISKDLFPCRTACVIMKYNPIICCDRLPAEFDLSHDVCVDILPRVHLPCFWVEKIPAAYFSPFNPWTASLLICTTWAPIVKTAKKLKPEVCRGGEHWVLSKERSS